MARMEPAAMNPVEHIFARIKALAGRLFIRSQMQKRVRTGVRFLNSVKPRWEKIDLEHPGHAAYAVMSLRSTVRKV